MKEINPSDKTFGNNLKKLRKIKYSNGQELAKKIGIEGKKGTTYYHYEQGKTFPNLERIIAIVNELGITYDLLFEPFLKEDDKNLIEIINRLRNVWVLKESYTSIDALLKGLEQKLEEEKEQREGGGEMEG